MKASAPEPGREEGGAAAPRPSRTRARFVIDALAIGILVAVAPFLPGLLGAVVLYVICAPLYRKLSPRLGESVTALFITFGVAILLLVPVVWLASIAIEQAPDALSRILGSDAFAQLRSLQIGPLDVGAQLSRAGELLAARASGQALALVGSLTRTILNLLLAGVGLYYLLKSADVVWARVRPLIPFSAEGANLLRERFALVTQATLLGIASTALAQGLIIGMAFWLVGLPDPIVWGVVTGCTAILPILGSSLVWGPGVIVLLVEQRFGAAAVLGVLGVVVVSNIDNAIQPMVYRRVSGVHPMATLVGAFAGVQLVGLSGLLLGPLAISYLFELLDLYEAEYGA
jgi:predicted PurR-regulated permease PerM